MAANPGNQVIRDLEYEIKKKWLFHPTAPRAACVLETGTILILSGASESESVEHWSEMKLHSTRKMVVISWSRDGNLASGCEDGAVMCWDVEKGDTYFEGHKHKKEVTHVIWNPFVPDQLLTCCWERVVRVWDTDSNELCFTLTIDQYLVFDIQWISEETFATCNAGHNVQIYDVAMGKMVKELAHQEPLTAILYKDEHRLLASSSYDATIKVWCLDVDKDVPWMELGNDESAVYCIDWLHQVNGKKVRSLIASGGADYFFVTIWDLRKQYSHQLGEGQFLDFIRDVRFSPDGQLLAAADNYGKVIVWNVHKWTKVVEMEVLPMPPDEPVDRPPDSRPACYRPLGFRCLDWNSSSNKLIISVDQPQVYVLEFNR